jgi:hypothetical protein
MHLSIAAAQGAWKFQIAAHRSLACNQRIRLVPVFEVFAGPGDMLRQLGRGNIMANILVQAR